MYRCTPQSSTQAKEQEERKRATELDIKDRGVKLRESERKVEWDKEKNSFLMRCMGQ